MTLDQMMDKDVFTLAGDTLDSGKYAYRIKRALTDAGYRVHCVGKELESLDDVPEDSIEVLDLCIHPAKGEALIRACHKPIGCVLIQPGAGSDTIRALLDEKGIPWLDGCALKGLEARGYKVL